MIRRRCKGLQVQMFGGRDPLTGRKRWLSRQVRGQTKAAWREAKKVEAPAPGAARPGGAARPPHPHGGELVERWLEWHQQGGSLLGTFSSAASTNRAAFTSRTTASAMGSSLGLSMQVSEG